MAAPLASRWARREASAMMVSAGLALLWVGHTPSRHSRGPSVGELADYLCTRHHSAVQLIDRTEQLGLIARHRSDSDDRRVVRITLTETGRDKLTLLSTTHVEELRQLATLVNALVDPATAEQTP
jgi:DNA-binding MarR family transcriptional regulator